eukprot:9495829-Pyramimonas_sp.AAC.1
MTLSVTAAALRPLGRAHHLLVRKDWRTRQVWTGLIPLAKANNCQARSQNLTRTPCPNHI